MNATMFKHAYRFFLNKGFPLDASREKMKAVVESLTESGCVNINVSYCFGFADQPSAVAGFVSHVYDGTQTWDVKAVTGDIGAVHAVISRAFPELKFISEDIEQITN